MGFFHDDWQFVFARSAGEDIKFFFTVDRPFMGTILAKSALVFGYNALMWQVAGLLLRLAGAYLFYALLITVFPTDDQPAPAFSAAILFIVYPGYLIFPSAVTHLPHMFALNFALLSYLLLIKSLEYQKFSCLPLFLGFLFMLGAGILTYAYLAALEYFIGYLGVLIVLLFLSLPKKGVGVTRRRQISLLISRAFFPLLAAAIFIYWRFWIFVPKRVAVDNDLIFRPLMINPFRQGGIYFVTLVKSFFETLFLAYITPLIRSISRTDGRDIVINILISCVLIGFVLWIGFRKMDRLENRWQLKWIITGLLLIVIPLIPVVLVGREVRLLDDYNRYTLQSIPGVAISLTGFLYLFKNPLRTVILAILVGVSALTLLNNQAQFANRWRVFQNAWQQIVIRAPGLEDGTVLAVHLPKGNRIAEGFEITAAANLIYQDSMPAQPTMPPIIGEIINEITLSNIIAQSVVDRYTKTVPLHLDYSHFLVFSWPTVGSCMHLIDSRFPLSEYEPTEIQTVAQYSHPEQVNLDADPPQLTEGLFQAKSGEDWCNLYQRANLAAQKGDWNAIVPLYEQVKVLGLFPGDRVEWIPFYLGYLKQGLVSSAEPIRQEILKSEPLIRQICVGTGFDPDLVRGLCTEPQN